MREKIGVTLKLNVSWNYFISAIYWKIHTCVAWRLSSSWHLLSSFSTWPFCTQCKKTDKILRWLGARNSPFLKSLLHVHAMVLCYHAIQSKNYSFSSLIASKSSCQIGSHFCDRNLLNNICFLMPSMYKSVKRNKNPQKKSVQQ